MGASQSSLYYIIPAERQKDDLLLLFIATANESVSTPSGWSRVGTGSEGLGTAGAVGAVKLSLFYKVSNGTETSVTIADVGNHQVGFMAVYRNVDIANPIEAFATNSINSGTVNFPSVTTSVANCLILNAIASDGDYASIYSARLSNWNNTNLSNLAEQDDAGTSFGVGSGLGYAQGELLTAGISGSTTADITEAQAQCLFTVALKPASSYKVYAVKNNQPVVFYDTVLSNVKSLPIVTYDIPIVLRNSNLNRSYRITIDKLNTILTTYNSSLSTLRRLHASTKNITTILGGSSAFIQVDTKTIVPTFYDLNHVGEYTGPIITVSTTIQVSYPEVLVKTGVKLSVPTKEFLVTYGTELHLVQITHTGNGLSVPTDHLRDSKKLEADAYVDLFQIHLSDGATKIFLKMNNTVTWGGDTYEGVGIQIEGVGNYSDEQVSRPKLTILNPDGIYSSLVNDGLLDNAKIYRYRVLKEHLDLNKPIYRKQRWRVSRVVSLKTPYIVLELRDMLDGQMFLTPGRMYIPPEFKSVSLR